MLPVLKFMKFTSQICENFKENYYNIAESSVIFSAASMFVKSSPTFEQSKYPAPCTSSVYGSLQCLIIPTLVSLEAVFERTTQVKNWSCTRSQC